MSLSTLHWIWIDLEMTGLDTQNDEIIEIATVITNTQLEVIAEGPSIAIQQPQAKLDAMDEWNQRVHGQSGLIERVQQSAYTTEEAEEKTLAFVRQYAAENTSPMCGNSICQDRRFLHRSMPRLEAYFHYRHLDVSSFKIIAQARNPELLEKLNKEVRHEALQDVYDSIEEMRFYSQHLLRDAD
jgi:oligoribonuclease